MAAKSSKKRAAPSLPAGWTRLDDKIRTDAADCKVVTTKRTIDEHLSEVRKGNFNAVLMLTVGGACPGLVASNPGLQKIILGAFGLPFGLMMTLLSGAELFTGNTALVTMALLEGRATAGQRSAADTAIVLGSQCRFRRGHGDAWADRISCSRPGSDWAGHAEAPARACAQGRGRPEAASAHAQRVR